MESFPPEKMPEFQVTNDLNKIEYVFRGLKNYNCRHGQDVDGFTFFHLIFLESCLKQAVYLTDPIGSSLLIQGLSQVENHCNDNDLMHIAPILFDLKDDEEVQRFVDYFWSGDGIFENLANRTLYSQISDQEFLYQLGFDNVDQLNLVTSTFESKKNNPDTFCFKHLTYVNIHYTNNFDVVHQLRIIKNYQKDIRFENVISENGKVTYLDNINMQHLKSLEKLSKL